MPPAGYSARCKTCNSARRLEIEAWHEDGKTYDDIEIILKSLGESISSVAIRNHFISHYNIQSAAKERYVQSQMVMEVAIEKRLTDIEILDSMIQDNNIIRSGLSAQIKDMGNKFSVPMPAVAMLNGVSAEICRAMKTKQDLLGESATDKVAGAIGAIAEMKIDDILAEYYGELKPDESKDT